MSSSSGARNLSSLRKGGSSKGLLGTNSKHNPLEGSSVHSAAALSQGSSHTTEDSLQETNVSPNKKNSTPRRPVRGSRRPVGTEPSSSSSARSRSQRRLWTDEGEAKVILSSSSTGTAIPKSSSHNSDENAAAALSSSAFDSGAFPAFDESATTFPSTTTTTTTKNNPFSSAFSNDDDDDAFFGNPNFGASLPAATTSSQEDVLFPNTTTSPNTSAAFEDFGGATSLFAFSSTEKPIQQPSWDLSPHDPTQIQQLVQQQQQQQQQRTSSDYNLQAKCFFRQKKSTLVATPILNPINSNIIFVVRDPANKGNVRIHEIDPHRYNNLPVASHSLLYETDALSIAMATKYNVTPVAIPQLWKLTAGRIDQSHGLRIACLADIAILESAAPMRVVLVYTWNNTSSSSSTLEQVLSPPAGGDFVYSPTSLEISDSGLCFLAGFSTAKGPCVLIHKITTTTTTIKNGNTNKNQETSPKESWSANFVAEGASNNNSNNTAPIIVGMSVAPYDSLPVVAIALADGSITVWSYAAALSSSASSVASKQQRWLLPWCRLDVTPVPNAERLAPSFDSSDTLGKGKVMIEIQTFDCDTVQ
jgi:hypothetical protein